MAATVMLVRPGPQGSPEVYLTRRHSRSRFMPDAFVFPGGAVDPADIVLARERVRGRCGNAALELVAAGVRETFEEAGILLASDAGSRPAVLGPAVLAAARTQINCGAPFTAFLEAHGLAIDANRLAYYSNWITPVDEPIRFDAHFFIAEAPPGQIAAADAMEVYDGVWLEPHAALRGGAAGEMTIRFPTQKHLERLAAFATVDDIMRAARTRVVEGPVRPANSGRDEYLLVEDW